MATSIAKRCELALSQMEALAKKVQSSKEYQATVDRRLADLEKKIQAGGVLSIERSQTKRETVSIDTVSAASNKSVTLQEYFKESGFRVIDYRSSGGALWVIGSEAELSPYVRYAEKQYSVTGRYGYGRATDGKHAWWTKDEK